MPLRSDRKQGVQPNGKCDCINRKSPTHSNGSDPHFQIQKSKPQGRQSGAPTRKMGGDPTLYLPLSTSSATAQRVGEACHLSGELRRKQESDEWLC